MPCAEADEERAPAKGQAAASEALSVETRRHKQLSIRTHANTHSIGLPPRLLRELSPLHLRSAISSKLSLVMV
ncbi:hypothetical protein GGTG_11916 [Gaeumannomyces tritici R3-111a-1]|uniref:Uncharacterized protein n=1 Tax=Gaeumannomyces tritici (strain R3-111a-1) TaxID=644352 RepID=J3PEI5_GAET3|nr:hypothetical protein GGTG_11916 [Gaeumannomyces tritici R3-111a-1]EJT70893.1 hypothetical protein GGTG_11916 [Gaeumannomyces tritici R3-111a-1]